MTPTRNSLLAAVATAALLATAATAPVLAQDEAAAGQREHALALLSHEHLEDVVLLHAPSAELLRKAAISYHGEVLEVSEATLTLVAQLPAAEQRRVQALGFTVAPATEWLAKRRAFVARARAAGGAALLGAAARARAEGAGAADESIPGFACYDTVEETGARLQAWARQYPKLVTLIDIGDSWVKTQGQGGYDLVVMKLTSQRLGGVKPVLLVNTGLHAREYAPVAVGTDFASKLLTGYGKDADATWILDHHEVHLLLQTNPDGRKHAETGLLWRKNANEAACTKQPNAQGVDLNRNFGFSWNTVRGGSSGAECAETYRGASAESEPETQALANYMRSLWPDNRGPGLTDPASPSTTGLHIDVHSAASLVLWPWGETRKASGNADAFQTLGRRLAFYNGYTPDVSVGLYPTDGTSDGPPYGELGVPSLTFELDKTFFEKCGDYSAKTGPDNVAALMYAAKVARQPYVWPAGPDVVDPKLGQAKVPAGTPAKLAAQATDTRFSSRNGSEPQQAIAAAEAYIDIPPWAPRSKAIALKAVDGQFNATTEAVAGELPTAGLRKGKHIVYVRARDASQVWGPPSAVFLWVR